MSKLTERVLVAFREVLSVPTKRDQQVTVGPSDLSDPCNFCLGRKMAGEAELRSFSMPLFLGSAIHKITEWLVSPGMMAEMDRTTLAYEVFGADTVSTELSIRKAIFIEGYGWCPAHVDLVLPDELALVDWKSTQMKYLRLYKVKGPPTAHIGQVMLYLHALRTNGYNVEKAVLVYVPKDAGSLYDIWAYELEYDAEAVAKIKQRAEAIMQWVAAGRWNELARDPECHRCNPGYTG